MSTYYNLLQETHDKLLQEATAYTILMELGSLQVELPTLVLTITPKSVFPSRYWTKEETHQPNWVKES